MGLREGEGEGEGEEEREGGGERLHWERFERCQ